MNVEAATMQVDYWEARDKYFEYRELVKTKRATKADEELRRAYREISLGKKVIDISLAITGAGVDEQGLPKLAIARADWEFVYAWSFNERILFTAKDASSYGWSSRERVAAHNVAVRFPTPRRDVHGKAQVPLIPPVHRPTGPLTSYRILFEAVWQRQPPDPDPLLLRPIGGPFYVVLAAWDLSPLEQAVLRAKL